MKPLQAIIHRMNKEELTQAIQDLEKRGYELITITTDDKTYKEYTYKPSGFVTKKYKGTELHRKYVAVMIKRS